MKKKISNLIDLIIGQKGEDFLLTRLNEISSSNEENTLTIVANKGVHHLPKHLLRGTVHYASEGSLNFENINTIEKEYKNILSELTDILQSKTWNNIYLVPFGHSTLSMQIKLLVYKITHIETIDIFYVSGKEYLDLNIKQRNIITKESNN